MNSGFVAAWGPDGSLPSDDALRQALLPDGPAHGLHREEGLALAWTDGVDRSKEASGICLLRGGGGLDAGGLLVRSRYQGWPGHEPAQGSCLIRASAGGDLLLYRAWDGGGGLFLAFQADCALIATELRSLLLLLPLRPPPDPLALGDWLLRGGSSDGRTLFQGIRALRAGETCVLDAGGSVRWRRAPLQIAASAWRPAVAHRPAVVLREAVDAAVARALEGAERPAVMLSGGLDSTIVAAAAIRSVAMTAERRLRVYSCVFPNHPSADEGTRVDAARGHLGIDGPLAAFAVVPATAAVPSPAEPETTDPLAPERTDPLSEAIDFINLWRVPSGNPNLFIWSPLLRRAASDGIDVVLDGEGGDELFGPAVFLLADRLRAGDIRGMVQLARTLPGLGANPRAIWVLRALAKYGVRGALPPGLHGQLRRIRRRPMPAASRLLAREQRGRDPRWRWKAGQSPLWQAHRLDLLTRAADDLDVGLQFQREGRMLGVQLRHPLRDPELSIWMLQIPPEFSYAPGIDRPLARAAFAGEVPPAILGTDHKASFDAVLADALREGGRPIVKELLGNLHPLLRDRLRPGLTVDLLRALEHPAAPWGWLSLLWRIVALQLWLLAQEDPEELVALRQMIRPGGQTVWKTN